MREVEFKGYNKIKGWVRGSCISEKKVIKQTCIKSNKDCVILFNFKL